ncbi:damage-inducible protein CinA [Synechococcus sp. KORDI-52]|uniref:competence/damage-inducible protein A n=1 Tax=Synechococcus sp. KORDI-52 TaxID=585425 RepID=UPI0004E069A9|nr:competence/damage-inducible protein A [Synechococcus sp. KORDI-52]AII47784.1 damage-inducible protein CinA [Synechococcus sp. KORDI-52]
MAEAGVEILCVGTELLLGDILNGNARWIAEQLACLGLPHYRQTVVGDNKDRLVAAVREASQRCRVLVTTGGLGPTPDDLTTEALAAAFETPLEERPELWLEIQRKLSAGGRAVALSNRSQAYFPRGAEILPNPKGSAPGMIWSPRPDFTILTFPGVPSEMQAMWTETAVPWLQANAGTSGVFVSRQLRFSGIGESDLAERVADLLTSTNPTVAPYASLGDVKLRLTACAPTADAAAQMLVPLEAELRRRTGDHCYGVDEDSLASVVIDLLRHRHQTMAVAESCTGGGLAAALTAVPGSSSVFQGGVVAYSNDVKQGLLGVSPDLLVTHGAVSEPVVEAMARGVRERLECDWAIAVSGIAGPGGGSVEKPVGLVHLALAGPHGCETWVQHFGERRGRAAIQRLSVIRGLDRLRLRLLAQV